LSTVSLFFAFCPLVKTKLEQIEIFKHVRHDSIYLLHQQCSANDTYTILQKMLTCISMTTTDTNGLFTVALPNIGHKAYLEVLSWYADMPTKKSVLMMLGRKLVGKSKLIMIKRDEWRNENRLVLDLSLKGEGMSVDDILKIFLAEYLQEIAKLSPTINAINTYKQITEDILIASKHVRTATKKIDDLVASSKLDLTTAELNDNKELVFLASSVAGYILDELKREQEESYEGYIRKDLKKKREKIETLATYFTIFLIFLKMMQKMVKNPS